MLQQEISASLNSDIYKVIPYGSSETGLWTSSSDIDFSIINTSMYAYNA